MAHADMHPRDAERQSINRQLTFAPAGGIEPFEQVFDARARGERDLFSLGGLSWIEEMHLVLLRDRGHDPTPAQLLGLHADVVAIASAPFAAMGRRHGAATGGAAQQAAQESAGP